MCSIASLAREWDRMTVDNLAMRDSLAESAVYSPQSGGTSKNGSERLRLLDLFCCAGGAAVGYNEAGFEIVGVDIDPQPRYPFEFIRADVMRLDLDFLSSFDAIHASPPCSFP